MSIFKWLALFAVAFVMAWVLIFTFTQEPFRELVPARVLAYQTPAIPIYIYVAGAFAIGLLIGLATAFYNYIVLSTKVHQKTKKINNLEQDLTVTREDLERLRQYSSEDNSMPGNNTDISNGGEIM